MDDSENRGRMRTSSTDQIAMFLALLTMSMGVAIVGPVLDDIRRDFDVSFTELGLIFALPTLARGVLHAPIGLFSRPILGPLADIPRRAIRGAERRWNGSGPEF